jgi:Resolvase, N terminal domain
MAAGLPTAPVLPPGPAACGRVAGGYTENLLDFHRLRRLLKDATARKIDMIAAWSVDRLGRSLQNLVGFLNELQAITQSETSVEFWFHVSGAEQEIDRQPAKGPGRAGVVSRLREGDVWTSPGSTGWRAAPAICSTSSGLIQDLISPKLDRHLCG